MIINNSITIKDLDKKIIIRGWVSKNRRLGDLIFIDLRNQYGITQIIIDKNSTSFDIANKLRNEYVIEVEGIVSKRKDANKNLESGEIEIIANKIIIINESQTTPLLIRDETDALEEKRLEYRYLDIRRSNIRNNLIVRSKLNSLIRKYFERNNFIEIETPTITKPTVGGAGEFKVISSNHKNKFYSLVQSPQIYKQLLMYGGFDSYYQIARCYRDEDSRSDRQLEFTQLDIEKSFTSEEEIRELIEKLLIEIVYMIKGEKIKLEFPVYSFEDVMENYGSDKPDLRFDNKLVNLSEVFDETKIEFIKNGLENNNEIYGLFFENDLSKNKIKKIEKELINQGAKGLSWARVESNKIVQGNAKFLSEIEIKKISEKTDYVNYSIYFMMDEKNHVREFMGRLRLILGNEHNLIDEDQLSFLWVVDWPLFELNSENIIESSHNPFTAPKDIEKLFESDSELEILKLKSSAYDIVLNGSEIGGGAIRISDWKLQEKVFELIGITKDEIQNNFGWFLEAMKYGIPKHGGIALGIDRLLTILLKQNSIRDVIAFPKSTSGYDEMTKAPIDDK